MALFLSAVSLLVLECVEGHAYRKPLLKEIEGISELSDTLCWSNMATGRQHLGSENHQTLCYFGVFQAWQPTVLLVRSCPVPLWRSNRIVSWFLRYILIFLGLILNFPMESLLFCCFQIVYQKTLSFKKLNLYAHIWILHIYIYIYKYIYIYINTWISLVNSPYLVGFSRRTVARPAGSAARGAEERTGAAVRRAGAAGRQGDAAGAMWTNLAGEEWVIIEVLNIAIEKGMYSWFNF